MYRTLAVRALWGQRVVVPLVRTQVPKVTLRTTFISRRLYATESSGESPPNTEIASQTTEIQESSTPHISSEEAQEPVFKHDEPFLATAAEEAASATETYIPIAETLGPTPEMEVFKPDVLEAEPTSSESDIRKSMGLTPQHSHKHSGETGVVVHKEQLVTRSLPSTCHGCGAFTQMNSPQHPGYYGLERKSVRQYLGLEQVVRKKPQDIYENHQVLAVINQIGARKLEQLGIDPRSLILEEDPDAETTIADQFDKSLKAPLCDRCHVLTHHNVGESIFHPSIHSLASTIDETPWKYNHVLHVIDAADFPMSFIPRLNELLGDYRIRTRNRRSQPHLFKNDRSMSMSFVVTRSDLLAPTKQQVDALLPYLREVLRDAMGKAGLNIRLGNMWCVSSKRGWWVQDLREEIWKRGGASWLVGKINVGKSQLFESIYPKGRIPGGKKAFAKEKMEFVEKLEKMERELKVSNEELFKDSVDGPPTGNVVMGEGEGPLALDQPVTEDGESLSLEEPKTQEAQSEDAPTPPEATTTEIATSEPPSTPALQSDTPTSLESSEPPALVPMIQEVDWLDINSWLPPARPLEMYPTMPIVSRHAGSTASPIRIPFGDNRGELVDLPGLARTSLTNSVMTKYREQLVMTSRIVPEQVSLKPGQSLLIGGMFRFTPKDENTVILAYNFTPMEEHVTHTRKAQEITEQRSDLRINNIAVPGVGSSMKSAGVFSLKYDVTRARAGPLTRKNAANFKVADLPFRVVSIDILIESVGWVELVAQVRTRHLYNDLPASLYEEKPEVPKNERAPKGKFSPEFKKGDPWHPEFGGAQPEDAWARMERISQTKTKDFVPKTPKSEQASVWDTIAEAQNESKKQITKAVVSQDVDRLPPPKWPEIEVFSPNGYYIGARRPLGGWLLNKPLVKKEHKRSRPRRSMKGEKKKRKALDRIAKQTAFTG